MKDLNSIKLENQWNTILDAANNNTFISEAYYGRGNALWNLGRSEEAAYMLSLIHISEPTRPY